MNVQPSSPQVRFSGFLSRFPSGVVALAKKCLPKLRRTFPGSYELVYEYSHSVVVAFGVTDKGYEALVALSLDENGVRLYFDKSLPDPKGLLEGSGSKVRSVPLKSVSDIDSGDIKAFFKAAIKHSGATFQKTGKTRLVIKSETKKKPGKSKRA